MTVRDKTGTSGRGTPRVPPSTGGVGPQGPQGATGAQGPQGAQGAQGAAGEQSSAWMWGGSAAPATNADRFAIQTYATPNAAESLGRLVVGAPATLRSLFVRCGGTLATDTVVYTLRVNGVDTTLTVTIPNGTNNMNVTGQAVAVVPDDVLSLKVRQNGTEALPSWNMRATVSS